MSPRDSSSTGSLAVAEPGHVLALDGVRGVAILTVLGSHLLLSNDISANPALQLLLDVRDLLWVGVTLFFALSGFLITGILYDTLGSRHYFRTFYIRRTLRIFPLYYGVLLVLLALTRPLHLDWHGAAWRLLTYTTNIPLTQELAIHPSRYINLAHFWSLAVEEQFYLLWPLVIFFLRSWRKVLVATIVGSVLALCFRSALASIGWAPQNHTLFGSMDALFLGGALALLVRSRYRNLALNLGLPVFLISVAVTLWQAFSHSRFDWWTSTYLTTIGMTILSLGMAAFVAASLKPSSAIQRFCSTSVLRFFGRYSYGLYVYHYSLDSSLTWPTRRFLLGYGAPKFVAILGAAALVSGISVAIAVLSYHLYEVQFLKLKRFAPNPRRVKTQDLETVPAHHG